MQIRCPVHRERVLGEDRHCPECGIAWTGSMGALQFIAVCAMNGLLPRDRDVMVGVAEIANNHGLDALKGRYPGAAMHFERAIAAGELPELGERGSGPAHRPYHFDDKRARRIPSVESLAAHDM